MEFSKEYILECIEKYCNVGEHLNEYSFYDCVVEPLEEAGCFPGMDYANGVTKGVILLPGCDFVVKLPFYGEEECIDYLDDLSYEEAMEEYGYDWSDRPKECYIEPFYGAQGRENCWDYCAVEAELYQEAVEEGLEHLFAKAERIGYANGWPVYIQARAVIQESMGSEEQDELTTEELVQADSLRQQDIGIYCSKIWIANLIRAYDIETFNLLSKFCERFRLGDFHDGNVGYCDGYPVLVDYSSYDG